MALQVKISLEGTKPPVWRRVLVPDTLTFLELHYVIQAAMGWDNAHLFAFQHPGQRYQDICVPLEDSWDDHETRDASEILINSELTSEKQKMKYEYDFGDAWTHTILVEKITAEKVLRPICLKGSGACPPEDCGGTWGYYDLVEQVNDPKNPEYEDMREWLGLEEGENWDVKAFSLEEGNQRLLS